MSNSEEGEGNNPYNGGGGANNRKPSSISLLGANDNEATIIQGKSDPLTGNYSEVAIRPKTESGSTTHIFNAKTRPMSEKDEDDNSVRFQYLVNEMSKKLKAEKYGRNSLTYQVSNNESDILADLNPAEERAVIAAARQKIELEEKEQEKERKQKEIDKYRTLKNRRETCPDCLLVFPWNAPYNVLGIHRKTCTHYQKRILREEEDQRLHDNHLGRYEYLFDRVSSLTTELSEIKKLMNSIRFTEAEASLDRQTPILSAAEEIKTKIMQEKEKRFSVIKNIDDFTNALETFYDKCLNDNAEAATTTQENKNNKSIPAR